MQKLFKPEECFRPTSVDEVLSILSNYEGAKIIAGGTDLLVDKPPEVKYLVDISRLKLRYIESDDGLKIGALTTIRDLETSPFLKNGPYLALIDAAQKFGSLPIRNTATVGGNICNAVPSADMPPALVALDAKVKIVGPKGEKIVPLENIFVSVKQTTLEKNELLTEIYVPKFPSHTGAAFMKFARTSVDLALVNTAVRITVDGQLMKQVRVVIGGGVGPTLIRCREAEKILENRKMNESALEEAAEVVAGELKPRATSIRGSEGYKREISKVLLKNTARKAWERATEA